jgi:hypothetical protein
MAHYYATITGARGPKTATGSKQSGIKAAAQSIDGSIIVEISQDSHGHDIVDISAGEGSTTRGRTIWSGPLADLMRTAGLHTFESIEQAADTL